MRLYCYHITPIDNWVGALTSEKLAATAWENYGADWKRLADFFKSVGELQAEAEAAFKAIGWEGDVREGPYYFVLPDDSSLSLGYMLKQDNDGACFIASSRPLSYLDGLAFEKTVAG